jgi:hypothetical protein
MFIEMCKKKNHQILHRKVLVVWNRKCASGGDDVDVD